MFLHCAVQLFPVPFFDLNLLDHLEHTNTNNSVREHEDDAQQPLHGDRRATFRHGSLRSWIGGGLTPLKGASLALKTDVYVNIAEGNVTFDKTWRCSRLVTRVTVGFQRMCGDIQFVHNSLDDERGEGISASWRLCIRVFRVPKIWTLLHHLSWLHYNEGIWWLDIVISPWRAGHLHGPSGGRERFHGLYFNALTIPGGLGTLLTKDEHVSYVDSSGRVREYVIVAIVPYLFPMRTLVLFVCRDYWSDGINYLLKTSTNPRRNHNCWPLCAAAARAERLSYSLWAFAAQNMVSTSLRQWWQKWCSNWQGSWPWSWSCSC